VDTNICPRKTAPPSLKQWNLFFFPLFELESCQVATIFPSVTKRCFGLRWCHRTCGVSPPFDPWAVPLYKHVSWPPMSQVTCSVCFIFGRYSPAVFPAMLSIAPFTPHVNYNIVSLFCFFYSQFLPSWISTFDLFFLPLVVCFSLLWNNSLILLSSSTPLPRLAPSLFIVSTPPSLL